MTLSIHDLFIQYGCAVLFFGLLAEYIALPFPGGTSMIYAGYLVYAGALNLWPAFIISFLGTTGGMVFTYWVGWKVGKPLIIKYGKWFFLSEEKLEKIRNWDTKLGPALLFIGYFIPGVRHLTGYFSGIVRLPFHTFVLLSFSGAFFWCLSCFMLGFVFGLRGQKIVGLLSVLSWKLIILFAIMMIIFYFLTRFFTTKSRQKNGF